MDNNKINTLFQQLQWSNKKSQMVDKLSTRLNAVKKISLGLDSKRQEWYKSITIYTFGELA